MRMIKFDTNCFVTISENRITIFVFLPFFFHFPFLICVHVSIRCTDFERLPRDIFTNSNHVTTNYDTIREGQYTSWNDTNRELASKPQAARWKSSPEGTERSGKRFAEARFSINESTARSIRSHVLNSEAVRQSSRRSNRSGRLPAFLPLPSAPPPPFPILWSLPEIPFAADERSAPLPLGFYARFLLLLLLFLRCWPRLHDYALAFLGPGIVLLVGRVYQRVILLILFHVFPHSAKRKKKRVSRA